MGAKSWLLPGLLVVLGGCVSVPDIKIDPAAFHGEGKKVATTVYKTDSNLWFETTEMRRAAAAAGAFAAIPGIGVLAAGVAGGVAGAAGAQAQKNRLGFTGEEFTKRHGLQDPRVRIERKIAEETARKYRLDYVGDAANPVTMSMDVETVANKNSEFPYVFDFYTRRWQLQEGKDSGKFSLNYTLKMQLIDTASKKVLAQGLCSYKSASDSVDLKDLQANDLTQLNDEDDKAVDFCIKQFSEKNLALIAPPPVNTAASK